MNIGELHVPAMPADSDGRMRIVMQADVIRHETYLRSVQLRPTPNGEALITSALLLGILAGRDVRMQVRDFLVEHMPGVLAAARSMRQIVQRIGMNRGVVRQEP
jgi:hypothetical protein